MAWYYIAGLQAAVYVQIGVLPHFIADSLISWLPSAAKSSNLVLIPVC